MSVTVTHAVPEERRIVAIRGEKGRGFFTYNHCLQRVFYTNLKGVTKEAKPISWRELLESTREKVYEGDTLSITFRG